MLSTHQIINFVLFLTSSFERTEFICSVIFSCFISFPTNRLSQRSPPEQIHYFRYFAIVTLTSNVLIHYFRFFTIVTSTSNVHYFRYNCHTYFQCSGSYWRQRWREAARRWCWMSGIRNPAVNLPSEPEHLYSLIHCYWTNDSATTDQDHQLKTSWPFEIDTSTKNYALDEKFLLLDSTWPSIWHLLISE